MFLTAADHARFMNRVRVNTATGCWEWTRGTRNGYGSFLLERTKQHYAHRVSYQHWIGPIPEGLQIDHLCRNSVCVNPSHLEAVTARENGRRGLKGVLTTHCPHGHAYDAENTIFEVTGWRKCRICRDARNRARSLKDAA